MEAMNCADHNPFLAWKQVLNAWDRRNPHAAFHAREVRLVGHKVTSCSLLDRQSFFKHWPIPVLRVCICVCRLLHKRFDEDRHVREVVACSCPWCAVLSLNRPCHSRHFAHVIHVFKRHKHCRVRVPAPQEHRQGIDMIDVAVCHQDCLRIHCGIAPANPRVQIQPQLFDHKAGALQRTRMSAQRESRRAIDVPSVAPVGGLRILHFDLHLLAHPLIAAASVTEARA
mmetsp:Transcript_37745/g.89287  ORF Transcript_37745/g.89287 Transcript_37745/m.89287 type:complete len:227 (+) Transcript_37745:1302-1982(+)